MIPRPLPSTLFPYTTLFRSDLLDEARHAMLHLVDEAQLVRIYRLIAAGAVEIARFERHLVHEVRQQARLLQRRSEEHTSELQSRRDLVCRLLLEKKNRAKAA